MPSRPIHLVAALCLLAVILATPGPVRAQRDCACTDHHSPVCCCRDTEEPIWNTFSDWQFKPGSARVIGEGELFVPLWQDSETLLFADLRGQLDDNQSREGNFGLGMRKLYDRQWIAGGYAFYDLRRTQFDNHFEQATVGIELLTVEWEARANGYIPEDVAKFVAGTGTEPTAVFSGGSVVLRSGGAAVERSYYGFDAEVGALLASWSEHADAELRAFAGGFHFDNDHAGFRNISGPRGRLELRLYDFEFLGAGSRVVLAGEVQWDQVRETTGFGMLQVRIPLNLGGRRQQTLSRIERRMVDRVVRDIDIVSHQQTTPIIDEPALDPFGGLPLGPVTIVDAETVDVPGTVADAGEGSTVFLDGSKGPIDISETVTTQTGQTILGGGQSMMVQGAQTGAVAEFTAPGTRPLVNGGDVGDSVFRIVSNAAIRGLDVTGGFHGIAGGEGIDELTDFKIVDNQVSGAVDSGIFLDADVQGHVLDNTLSFNGNSGFRSGAVGGTFTGNTASMNQGAGFETGDIDADFSNNTASGNDGDGFDTGDIQGTFTGNTATANGDDGFVAGHIDAHFAGNTSTHNGGFGFRTDDIGGSFTENSAEGNSSDGFYLGDIDANFSGNTAIRNEGWGFDTGDIKGTFTGNSAVRNRDRGFDTGDIDADFADNTASENDGDGFRTGDIEGTFTGNSAVRNWGTGFDTRDIDAIFSGNTSTHNEDFGFDTGDINGTFAGNTAEGNWADGFYLGDIEGTFTDNTSNENAGWGFDTGDINGTFAGNTAERNWADGFYLGDIEGTFTDNMSIENADWGFDIGDVQGTFTGNSASGNGYIGFDIDNIDATFANNTSDLNYDAGFRTGSVHGEFTGNSANGNGREGFDTGDIDAIFTSNTSTENHGYGFQTGDINGTFSANTAEGNWDHGFHLGNINGTLTSNTADSNDGDGFRLDDIFGVFSDNSATGNLGDGYNVGENFGTADNNTGAGNGDNNEYP